MGVAGNFLFLTINFFEVAETQLRGAPIDVEPAVQRFMANLKKEDIVFDPQTGALDFNNSSIEGLTDLQGIIKRTINRIYNTKAPTAYDAHRAKRFLDEQVTYGKTQAGTCRQPCSSSTSSGFQPGSNAATSDQNRFEWFMCRRWQSSWSMR